MFDRQNDIVKIWCYFGRLTLVIQIELGQRVCHWLWINLVLLHVHVKHVEQMYLDMVLAAYVSAFIVHFTYFVFLFPEMIIDIWSLIL